MMCLQNFEMFISELLIPKELKKIKICTKVLKSNSTRYKVFFGEIFHTFSYETPKTICALNNLSHEL